LRKEVKVEAAEQGTEIAFVNGEVPLPPSIRPLILLSGSDYDMGYQYYQQLVQIFGPWILSRVGHDRFGSEKQGQLKVYERHIRENAPEMIDMFNGMVDGATAAGIALTYEEILAHFCREREPGTEEILASGGCSGFAAWGSATKDGRLICAGSTDHELKFEVTLAVFPLTGHRYIYSPFRPTEFGVSGGHPGMNNKGLAYVHHGATHWIQCKPREERTEGIPEGIAILHTLRFASSAIEARDMQLAYPSGNGFAGGFWADIEGNAFVIECREHPRAIRKAGDYGERDFLYSTNNALCKELGHCQDPPPEGNTYIDHGGWLGTGNTITSVPRNLGLWKMLHYYHGEVDLDFVRMVCRFSGEAPSYPTLEEADAAYFETKGEGWHIKMCDQWNAMVGIMVPDNGSEGLYYVCNGCPARVAYPFGPKGYSFQPSPTYSFYELKLSRGGRNHRSSQRPSSICALLCKLSTQKTELFGCSI
jgi:hypothetical protein